MENNIKVFEAYIDQLDDVYKAAAKTAVLDTSDAVVSMTKAGVFQIPKMEMDGLGDYSRKDGYAKGGVSIEFEEKKADYDRGRKFGVDAVDDEETAGIAFGKLSGEFVRTKAAPELDAYRFAKYAALAGTVDEATLASGTDVLNRLNAVYAAMSEAEVPEENRILFITPTLLRIAKSVDTNKDKAILDMFAQVVEVPQTRFYTAISLLDGKTSGEEAGHYVKAESGKNINFMVIHKPAVIQGTKHRVNKIITPEANQEDDSWLFFYRAYGIAEVYDNKTDGVFVCVDAA